MGFAENLIDKVEITVKSGDGGNGIVHFRHEKYINKGGPDGGDGGRGGDIIFKTNNQLSTLVNLRYTHHVVAKNGENGGKNNCTGHDAEDVIIEVPNGTIIYDKNTNDILADLIKDDSYTIKGGKGGLGNTHFKSPTNQTPRYATNGQKGISLELILELSLLADVGLVGFPNAGKSTLLSVLTNAKPKIGDYPFTTITPQLGVLKYKSNKECVIADFPGIIENAHLGKGLGNRFLQHIKRVKLIIFLIDIDDNISNTLNILKQELHKYNSEMSKLPYLVCVSKCDKYVEDKSKFNNNKCIYISSFSKVGINNLIENIFKILS